MAIWPSLLAADFAELTRAVAAAERGGADALHCDVMDGHFVPNISFGPALVAAVRHRTQLPLDVHLMVERPEAWLQPFADAGAASLTIHYEATRHPQRALSEIRRLGCRSGLALNPATGAAALDYLWDDLDLVLVMTVNPGFGGQHFLRAVLPKIGALRAEAARRGFPGQIAVDGGVDAATAPAAVAAGANVLIAGSSVYGADDPVAAIATLRRAAQNGANTIS